MDARTKQIAAVLVIAVIAVGGGLIMTLTSGKSLEDILPKIDWTLITFFTSLFIIVNKGLDLFGELTEEEIEQYYNLKYINKIYSAKTNDGEETPLFWVI